MQNDPGTWLSRVVSFLPKEGVKPDANWGVEGPAGSKKAAKRCTEAIRTVGPTLTKERKLKT